MRNLLLILTFVLISASQASAAENILSIDGSLIVQIIIFVAVIFILKKILFTPLLDLLEKREELTVGKTKEAKRLGDEVQQIIKDYTIKLNEARTLALEERNEIRREAVEAYEQLTGKSRREAQALLEDARRQLEVETKTIKEKLKPEIEVLARDLASRVLGKEVRK